MTLLEMLQSSVERWPAKPAVIGDETLLSYGELFGQVGALAEWLVNFGLRKGERVALLLDKTPEAIVAYLGVNAAGGIVAPINCKLSEKEIQQAMDLVAPRVVIAATSQLVLLGRLRSGCIGESVIAVGADVVVGGTTWASITSRPVYHLPGIPVKEDDVSYLNFTSGSTGAPKAALATHGNIYWNTRASVECLDLTHDDIHLIMFPVFMHPHELLARPLYLGGTTVLVNGISPRAIADAIVQHKVTCLMAVASIYASLARYHRSHPFDMSSIRLAESGGMYVDRILAETFEAECGCVIRPVWGSTETTGIALANWMNAPVRRGASGKPCPYYEVRLVDEGGQDAQPGEIGEMFVKGPGVALGYYNNPVDSAAHFRDGWFHTQDLFQMDADGYLYFVGRWSGMIKMAGRKVFPLEIENAIKTHPAVEDVVVVGIKDNTQGEVPKAVVVLRENCSVTRRDLRMHCSCQLAGHKVPRIIEFVREIPRTAGGKIDHRALKR